MHLWNEGAAAYFSVVFPCWKFNITIYSSFISNSSLKSKATDVKVLKAKIVTFIKWKQLFPPDYKSSTGLLYNEKNSDSTKTWKVKERKSVLSHHTEITSV